MPHRTSPELSLEISQPRIQCQENTLFRNTPRFRFHTELYLTSSKPSLPSALPASYTPKKKHKQRENKEMHCYNLLITLTVTLLGMNATASPTPVEQREQEAQTALSPQSQQELQELLSKQGIQGERCLRTCYPQKPICNGSGSVRTGTRPPLLDAPSLFPHFVQ
ncbi:hypothetical protein AJ78_02422 [Emergomyces pasteurianus Ep9510]|uniref:Uncharacterized protein n=1 Tax=Emergomyces pasteurianus Ep9510 TaxID=1447872 RepID=A0A1J9QQH0_9EURO|nr:hypothetical protein AJ78_02422 [Emergomyces pasteurianus Ep9510]